MGKATGVRDRIGRAFQSLFMEDAYITRIYYESMRDNFEGYDVTNDLEGFGALRREFEAFAPGGQRDPTLGELFRIEVALLRHLPNSAIEARFWSIDDRFRRVVPQSVIDSYDRRTPSPGDDKWSDIDFVRNQSRSLLDVIHANYLINLGREQSTKRLMFIIAMAALAILAVSGLFVFTPLATDGQKGLIVLAMAGMFGAMISIVNRLQKATSRDAMAQDGIFELIGLRTGWVSILMSVCIGGVFSILLYAMVMGGLSDVVFPSVETAEQSGDDSSDPGDEGTGEDETAPSTAQGESAANPPGEANDASASSAAQAPGSTNEAAPADRSVAPAKDAGKAGQGDAKKENKPDGGSEGQDPEKPAKSWIDTLVAGLDFPSHEDFYKMLVFAFLAGFAERFVPDILNRLSKQGKPS